VVRLIFLVKTCSQYPAVKFWNDVTTLMTVEGERARDYVGRVDKKYGRKTQRGRTRDDESLGQRDTTLCAI
jgi:hypothetical protein